MVLCCIVRFTTSGSATSDWAMRLLPGTVRDKASWEQACRPNKHSNKAPLDASNDTNLLLCYSDFHSITDLIGFIGVRGEERLYVHLILTYHLNQRHTLHH